MPVAMLEGRETAFPEIERPATPPQLFGCEPPRQPLQLPRWDNQWTKTQDTQLGCSCGDPDLPNPQSVVTIKKTVVLKQPNPAPTPHRPANT